MKSNITLIFTRHKEGGICTVNALLQIIEAVNPDVIFEELSEALFKEAYETNTLNNLESVAIRAYILKHLLPHVPVDTYPRTSKYNEDQSVLSQKLTESAGYESAQLRGFLDQVYAIGSKYGFTYLNDSANDENMDKVESLKQAVLRKLDDPKLRELYRKDKEVILKREDVMLDNVYRYAAENPFIKGLMFVGSGHRKAMMKKIEKRNETEGIKINWKFYQELIIK
tara:strand:- start:21011 stop:21688 length:678 start_codon:yes stop_codon:yes gene_type:complete